MRPLRLRPAPSTTLTIVIAISVSLLPLLEVFDGSIWLARVCGGVIVAATLATLLETRWRIGAPVIAAITGVGAAVWAMIVVGPSFRDDPVSLTPLDHLGTGIFSGWSALLDEQVPLRDEPSAQIFVGFVAWVATAVAVHVAARRHSAIAAMGACASVLWIGIAAALPQGLAPSVIGAGVGAAALVAVATLSHGSDDRWRIGRAISLVVVVGIAGVLATVAGEVTSDVRAEPVDPRSSRSTSVVSRVVPDILGDYGSLLAAGADIMTVASTSSSPLPSELRLRVQVYDTHDGERWLPSTDYREVASFPEPDILPPGEQVRLRISVRDLDRPWLPLPDRLVGIDLDDIQWNEASQTALVDRDLRTYRVTGTVVDRSGLDGLASARDEVDDRFTEIPPSLPGSLRSTAENTTREAPDAISAIDALSDFVRDIGRDDTVPPGHSMARLRDDLAVAAPTGAEQLASLHALMARALGHPARVVVGYVTDDAEVESDDLHIWTEVAFTGIGWVAMDPVPPPAAPSGDVAPDSSTTTTTAPDAVVVPARALPRELGPGEDPGQSEPSVPREYTWRDAVVVALALIVLVTVGLVAARVIRRRGRRGQIRPDLRVMGAWGELIDRLREAGAPVAATTTVGDVVYMAETMDHALGEAAAVMAAAASEALHGPWGVTAEQSDDAWDALVRAERALVELRGRRVTVARVLDPRALRYHAPDPPGSRTGGRRS